MQDQSIWWFTLLTVLVAFGIWASNLAIAYWARKSFSVAEHRRWLIAIAVFFFTLMLWSVVTGFWASTAEAYDHWGIAPDPSSFDYAAYLNLERLETVAKWTIANQFVVPLLLLLDLLIFRLVDGRLATPTAYASSKQRTHPLVVVGWVSMLFISLFYVLLLLVPYYASGIDHMTTSQIYSTDIDLSWHPYYAGKTAALYTLALPVVQTGMCMGLPLFIFLVGELIMHSRKLSRQAIFVRSALVLSQVAVIIVAFVSFGKMITWILD